MNKKLFVKRLGISLLWVLAPFVAVGAAVYALLWFVSLVGTDTAINLGFAVWFVLMVYLFYGQALLRHWNTWTDWLTAREDLEGLDVLAHSAKVKNEQP